MNEIDIVGSKIVNYINTILCHQHDLRQKVILFLVCLYTLKAFCACFNRCQILETVEAATWALSCYMRAYFQVSNKAVCLNLEALNSPFSTMKILHLPPL